MRLDLALRTTVLAGAGLIAFAVSARAETVVIKQQGRSFQPGAVEIMAGDTIRIINDDEGLLHHAYLDADAFSFDIGEQESGQSSDIVFPVAGVFDVFCGIHPKMKLQVTVK